MVTVKRIAVLGIFGVLLVTGCTETKGREVNEVLTDPSALNGPVALVGIAVGMSQDPAVFGIMDKKELKCTTPNCDKLILPVRYKGKPPLRGDEVLISGAFVKDVNGYVFGAEKVKVLGHHVLQAKK